MCQTSQQASVLAKEGRFEGSCAPKSQTLIVLSADPDTILVPSGENAADMTKLLWAFVFSATQLMSIAIILRTRDMCVHSAAHGDMGPQCGSNIEGRLNGLDADMQQPTACRKDEGDRVRRVAPKLIAKAERQPSSRPQDWAVTWR